MKISTFGNIDRELVQAESEECRKNGKWSLNRKKIPGGTTEWQHKGVTEAPVKAVAVSENFFSYCIRER